MAALEGAHDGRDAGSATFDHLLTELQASLEELCAAEEDLRSANEELREARAELEAQRARFQDLFEQAPLAYLVTDTSGTVREANRAACALLGVDARRLTGKPITEFVSLEDRPELRARLNHLADATPSDGWMLHLAPGEGEATTAGVTLGAVRNGDGSVSALRWILRDLTERDRMEQALIGSLRQHEVILHAAAEGICGVDAAGLVTFANPAAAQMLGWTEHQLVGCDLLEVLSVKGAAGRRLPLHDTLHRGRAEHGEWEHARRRDGTTVQLEYYARALVNGPHVVGAVVSFTDIGERKRLEVELQHQADHDGLTDLLNRRAFERELSRELALTARYRTPTSVMLLDVDGLKQVNDAHGHLAGDELLRRVGVVLRTRLRRTDVAARIGGDEFGVLLPRSDAGAAMTVADQVLSVLRRHEASAGRPDPISASIGVATADVGGLTTDDVLRGADYAMYDAKQGGGDRVARVTSLRRRTRR